MPKTRRSAQEMFPLIALYLESRHTQSAFCALHDLNLAVLNYWIARYKEQSHQEGSFVEITPDASPVDRALMEVCYPHGVRLRLFAPLPVATMTHLLGLQRT